MLNLGLESDFGGCWYAVALGTTVGGMVGVRVLLTVTAAGHHFLGDIDLRMRLRLCSYQLSWYRWRQWRGSSMISNGSAMTSVAASGHLLLWS